MGQVYKIEEIERIRKEEKEERLAICKQKKKKYRLKQLNKEENKRIKERSEERILISQAKANYWKMHRGGKKGYEEKYEQHWRNIKDGILALEEEGSWISKEDCIQDAANKEEMIGVGVQVRD